MAVTADGLLICTAINQAIFWLHQNELSPRVMYHRFATYLAATPRTERGIPPEAQFIVQKGFGASVVHAREKSS